MKNIIIYIIVVLSFFFFVDSAKAMSNTGVFKELYYDDMGLFYNNVNSTSVSSIGYHKEFIPLYDSNLEEFTSFYGFTPQTVTSMQNYGITLTQCGLNMVEGNYYSFTYYFFSTISNYIYPWYSNVSYKLGLYNTTNSSYWTSGARTFNDFTHTTDMRVSELNNNYVHSFGFTFKAPKNGTCLNLALNTSYSSYTDDYYFVGLQYQDMGSKAPTTQEIQNALSSNFNTINNNITNMQNSINSNINELKDKQDETNQTLDEIKDMDISDEDKELPDDTDFNDYQDAEDDLMDKVSEADMSVIDIAIDEDSSNFVWDTLTDLIQSHTLIFSTVIAILSIGIIKLALGR